MTQGRVDQITEPRALRNHSDRLALLEQPAPGQFHFFLPIAPAPDPTDLLPSDDLSTLFTGGWLNTTLPDSTYSPLRYRVYPAGKVELVGAIKGGTVPSVCGVLPRQFWPRNDEVIALVSPDGTQTMSVSISSTTGEVTVLSVSGGESEDGDIYFETSSVPSGAFHSLAWALSSGPGLLDLTAPTQPLIKAAGTYAFTISVSCEFGDQVGKFMALELDVDESGRDPFVLSTIPLEAGGTSNPTATVAMTFKVPAGALIDAAIRHNIGSDHDFRLNANVQRIS